MLARTGDVQHTGDGRITQYPTVRRISSLNVCGHPTKGLFLVKIFQFGLHQNCPLWAFFRKIFDCTSHSHIFSGKFAYYINLF